MGAGREEEGSYEVDLRVDGRTMLSESRITGNFKKEINMAELCEN